MAGIEKIGEMIKQHGYADFKWISGKGIVTAQWVRFKCMYGCSAYGRKGSCPPNNPPLNECRDFFREYENIAIIHFEKKFDDPEIRHEWAKKINLDLLELEKKVFLAGFPKTFLLFMDECNICNECSGIRTDCNNPKQSRPCPEGLGVDVFSTVRKCGYTLEILTDYSQTMNRFSFLLVE